MQHAVVTIMIAGLVSPMLALVDEPPSPSQNTQRQLEWRRLPDLPDREGFASGFGGVSGGHLIFAGGANFPEKKPWEGGRKVWYDQIYVLDSFEGQWRSAGQLPRPLAYGVSVTWKNSVVCVGGSDEKQHYREAFRMTLVGGAVEISELPPLPVPIANASGGIAGDLLFVVGGQKSPASNVAERTVFVLNLAETAAGWSQLADLPAAGRILSITVASDDSFFVMSGAELITDGEGRAARRYLSDAWKFDWHTGWSELPRLPEPVAAGPSPGFFEHLGLFIVEGDNGLQLKASPAEHRGFSDRILVLADDQSRWNEVGVAPIARVTACTAEWNGWNVILSGEQRPGIRSPEVWAFRSVNNPLPCVP